MTSFFKIPFITNLFKVEEVDGYENIQKRISTKKDYLDNILSYFKNLESLFREIPEKIHNYNYNLSNFIVVPEEQNIHDSIKSIGKDIFGDTVEILKLLREMINHISTHRNTLSKEITIYEELKKINKDLKEEKEKLKKNKEMFHKVGKKAEDDIKNFIKNIPDINDIYENEIINFDLNKIVENPREVFKNYKNSLERTNKLIKKFNSKQLLLFNYYPELSSEEGVFFFRLIKLYLQYLEKKNSDLNVNIEKIKNNKQLETNTKLIELIEISENNKKEEKIQSLIPYQSELDFNKCKDDKQFILFSNSMNIIKNFISNDLFPNYDYDIEVKNYRMSKVIKKLFNETGELEPKLIEDYLNIMNDPSVYRGFFVVLSQLRTNSKFLRDKNVIDLLGNGFNIITEYSANNKIYDNIKNCIILSQTYYYEDEKKNKIYIFERIKDNKYLRNSRFWRDFIQDMIKKEFKRFESVFPDANINIDKNIGITKKIKEKLNEVVFSQLLTYASNMKDFEIDKKVIIKIIDEFIQKYNYLSKNNKDNIYMVITQGEEDIEKLRKEYDPSLEDELIEYKKNDEKKVEKENEKEKNGEESRNNEKKVEKENDKEKNGKESTIEENNQKENDIKNNNNEINNINEEQKENENDIITEDKLENNIINEDKKENNIKEENIKENDNEDINRIE